MRARFALCGFFSYILTILQSINGPNIPTLGGLLRIPGANLGGLALTSNIQVLYDNLVVNSQSSPRPAVIVNFTQTAIIVSLPPGDGVNHTLQVTGVVMC